MRVFIIVLALIVLLSAFGLPSIALKQPERLYNWSWQEQDYSSVPLYKPYTYQPYKYNWQEEGSFSEPYRYREGPDVPVYKKQFDCKWVYEWDDYTNSWQKHFRCDWFEK